MSLWFACVSACDCLNRVRWRRGKWGKRSDEVFFSVDNISIFWLCLIFLIFSYFVSQHGDTIYYQHTITLCAYNTCPLESRGEYQHRVIGVLSFGAKGSRETYSEKSRDFVCDVSRMFGGFIAHDVSRSLSGS